MKCRQCHFWNKINGTYRCNCIDGAGTESPHTSACKHFDYWRNYEHVMSDDRALDWAILSGEIKIANEQLALF